MKNQTHTSPLALLVLLMALPAAPHLLAQEGGTAAGAPPGNAAAHPQKVKFERLPNGDIQLGGIRVHRKTRQISFDAKINQLSGPLEVLIATPAGRLHESLLCADISPLHLQTVLYLLNLENGPRSPDEAGHQGALLDIDLQWQNEKGETVIEPIEKWVVDQRTGKPMKRFGWVFVGSSIVEGAFQADVGGNLVLVYTGAETILDIPDKGGEDDTLFVANEQKTSPGIDAKARVIITPRKTKTDE